MQVRDLFAMREHYGWADYIAQKAARLNGPAGRAAEKLRKQLAEHTDARSAAFDTMHGTETFKRGAFACRESMPPEQESWGYGPVNQDFFREIMRAVPDDLSRYVFVDIGAGKGAALMLASEFGFRRYIGVELAQELIELGRLNIDKYVASTKRPFDPEWVQADFLKWPIPNVDSLYFINNSLPAELSVRAVKRLEDAALATGQRLLLAYRKASSSVANHLNASDAWRPLRLAPYWRIDGINITP